MKSLMLVTMLLMTSCVAEEDTQNCTDCHTKHCISFVGATLNAIDRRFKPCDNFYRYACGRWLRQQILTDERDIINFSDTVEPLEATIKLLSQGFKDGDTNAVKKAKNLFKSCQNYVPGYGHNISNIVTSLFGTWPLGCEQCNLSPYNLERSLIETTRLGAHPLFTLSVRVNHLGYNVTTRNFKRYLHIGKPTQIVRVDDNSKLENVDTQKKKQTKALYFDVLKEKYVDYIIAAARNFVSINDEAAVREDARQIVNVEQEISHHIYYGRNEDIMSSLSSLDDDYGQLMNWTRYVNELASTRATFGGEITQDEIIFVNRHRALISIIDYFLGLPKRTQVNYLAWRLVDTLLNVAIKLEEKQEIIYGNGAPEDHDSAHRHEGCAWFVTETLPMAVERLLYDEYLSSDTIQKVNMMLQQIKYEFNALPHYKRWIYENATRFIKEKIDSITTVVGNYFEVMDDEFLDSYYSSVPIVSTHEYIDRNFPSLVVMVKREAFNINFWSIKLPAKLDFEQPPQVFSSHLIHEKHEIVLSFASVFRPWFMDEAPMVVNYAGAMYTLAHTLLQSVGTEGMQFHRNGTKGSWMDPWTNVEFEKRWHCFRDPWENQNLSQKLVEYNVALGLAFRAYKNYTKRTTEKRYNIRYSGFTNDQLFFLRTTQLLCKKEDEGEYPPIPSYGYMVNNPLFNSKDFAYVFECNCWTPMNPADKCELW